ncbi:clan AA aspartic protease [Salinisphaera sp. C84B14]|uniref:retropepsin-like aspartic protease family protein n=1 Tax=Salinisphaera sp. C84B14 TaxID=1304155 RepID=UPI00333FBFB8
MSQSLRPLYPVVGTFVLLGLLWWGFDQLLDRRAHPNRDVAVGAEAPERLVLDAGPGGHYMVPGEINGQAVRFLIDTGASHVAVPADMAERLGLSRGAPMIVETAAGRVRAHATRLGSVRVGGFTQYDVRASINPAMATDFVLLGMTFLRHVDISQRDGRLILEPPAGR